MPGGRDARDLLAELRAAADAVTDGIPFGVHDGRLIMCRGTTEAELVEWIEKVFALKEKLRDL